MIVIRSETEILEDIFQKTFDTGKGSTILVTGESGIGKSFLLKDFIEKKVQKHKSFPKLKVISAAAENDRRYTDLYAWKELLIDLETNLGSLAVWNGKAETPEIDYKKLVRNVFDEQGADWLKLIPVVGESATILLKAIKGIKKETDAQNKARELLKPNTNIIYNNEDDRFKHLMFKLRMLAETDIVTLFIKDIQFFDKSSLDLFYKLSKNLTEDPYRLILIGSYCEEDLISEKLDASTGRIEIQPVEISLENLRKINSYREVNLKRFSLSQIEEFTKMKFPVNEFKDDLKNILEKISNGNPLYLEAVVKNLKDNGFIFEEEGKFKNKSIFDYSLVPENIQEIIKKRYNSLDKDLKKIVNLASVMGDDFSAEIISDIIKEDMTDLHLKIDILKDEYEIIEKVKKNYFKLSLIYKFIHYLYQKYVYNKLTEDELNIIFHKNVSDSLRKIFPGEKINLILEQYSYHLGLGNRIISEKGKVILEKENLIDEELKETVFEYSDILKKQLAGYEKTFSYEEAINKCRILISIYEILKDKELIFEYNLKIAIFLKDANKWTESASEFNNALKIAEELNDKPKVALCYLEMSNLFENTKESDKAINCLNNFLKISEELKDENLLTRAYVTFGNIYRNKSNNEEALINYRKALDYREGTGDEQRIGVIYLNMGNVYYNQSELSDALEYYLKAKKIFEKLDDRKHLPKVIKNIGNIYFIKRQFDEALTQYNTAKIKFNESGNIKEEADIFVNIGSVNYNLRRTDLSIEYYEQAITIYKILGEKENKAICLKNLGLCYIEKNNYDKALELFEEASKINYEIKSKAQTASCDFEIGDIHFIKNNIVTAFEFYDKAIKLLKEIPKANNLPSFLFRKANSLYKLKNFDEAGRINTEAKDAALKTEKSDIVFRSELLNAKLISVTDKAKSINLLNDLLTTINDEQERAEVYCELFKISGENEYRIKSFDIYTKLNTDNPCEEYLQKINELK